MLNILGKRYWFFALSLVIILSGILLLAVRGVPISIDFKGGTLLEVEFASENLPIQPRSKQSTTKWIFPMPRFRPLLMAS